MAAVRRSRIEPDSSTAKPVTSPRAQLRSKPAPAKTTARRRTAAIEDARTDVRSRSKKSTARAAKLVSSKLAFKGKVFNVYTDTVVEPGGHRATRDVIRHNGSVVILAVDDSKNPADPDIILERQYRHAAGKFLIELPAGSRNPDEAPLAAAKREMIEETGYRAKRWTCLIKYFASPGFLGEWMQIYLARDLSHGKAAPEEDEDLEVFRMPLSQIMRKIAAGEIHDGKTVIGLSLYDAARRDGRL